MIKEMKNQKVSKNVPASLQGIRSWIFSKI